jgi:hypothetical protein
MFWMVWPLVVVLQPAVDQGADSDWSVKAQESHSVVAWTESQKFSAAEAVQAAAADAHYFYAINNTHVAKYDRFTGELVATSRGPVKHLNSGFLWQGKLYCAHSNYPALPEQSEIKLLDIESMELTTYHDFENYGGSLTWCVRHEEHWWCHFAKYGADNVHSFLVEFTNDWREQHRWRLPYELTEKLGRHSLSGGLWWKGALLATGHDERVIYRLLVPDDGEVLRLVDEYPVPFSGQGIAVDPISDRLIGIDRAARTVLFASPR